MTGLRDRAAIVGIGATEFSKNSGRSELQLAVECIRAALEDAGLVEHLHLGHGPAVYHLAEHDHRHLVCQNCKRVIDVDEADFGELVALVHDRFGFSLDVRHFALPGRCEDCTTDS